MLPNRTDEVFGISRSVPLNYVSRPDADELFINALSRKKHIVLHGSSKQGKTSLRKECLASGDSITIQCLSSWSLGDVHQAILKEAGFTVTLSESRTHSGKQKALITLKGGVKVPLAGGFGAEVASGRDNEMSQQVEWKPLDLDVDDVNDVIRALISINFDQFITLEDFHYLPDQTQRDFATALKAYHELSDLCFIIVAVWLEHDRLSLYNGDLVGRVISVNVDAWPEEYLYKVIAKGCNLLNINFPQPFVDQLVKGCLESVYIVQEVCNRVCINADIYETSETIAEVVVTETAETLIAKIVSEQAARYRESLVRFRDGFKDTQLEMFKWLTYVILDASKEQLENGLRYRDISAKLLEVHPSGKNLKLSNLTLALRNVADLQVARGIKPLMLDYDQTSSRLGVVDRSFLIWLISQDREELKEEIHAS